MKEALKIVESLTDVQTISLIKQMYRKIYKAVPYQDVINKLPVQVEPLEALKSLDQEVKNKKFSASDSVALAKQILLVYAKDEQLSDILIAAWEDIKNDDKLFIETILAIGLVVNVTIFIATSEIEYKDGKIHFIKGKADAGILKTILEPVVELIKKSPLKA